MRALHVIDTRDVPFLPYSVLAWCAPMPVSHGSAYLHTWIAIAKKDRKENKTEESIHSVRRSQAPGSIVIERINQILYWW